MSDELRVLAVEDVLAADADGTERDRILARLRRLAAAARANLDKGVTPLDARRLVALIAALESAQAVTTRVWTLFHRLPR